MGRSITLGGITNESGYIANINASGQLAVQASVNVGSVTTGISGQTIYLAAQEVSGTFPSIYVTQSGQPISGIPHKLVVGFSGENTIAKISGETITVANLSGTPVTVSVSGNTVIAKTSGETNISKISGETIIAKISGETVIALVDLSGVTLNVDSIVVNISGQVTKSEISGQKVRFGDSGFSYVQLQAFDYTNTTFRNVASDSSGVVSVTASVTANISGQTVRTFAASGQNAVYITNQSGNVAIALTDAGAQIVTVSGNVVSTSGGVSKISGETVAIWGASGRNAVYLTNQAGTSGVTIDAFGRLTVTTSGVTVIAKVSGEVVNISGNAVTTSISGNVVSTSVSGNVVIAKVSGETLNTTLLVSGGVPVAAMATTSGAALLTIQATKTIFKAYPTLMITALSGGTTLLSGNATVVSIRNIGVSGTVMYVGSSGTGNAPWCTTNESGLGWRLNSQDAITIPIENPNQLRVATITTQSGRRISYMISADL